MKPICLKNILQRVQSFVLAAHPERARPRAQQCPSSRCARQIPAPPSLRALLRPRTGALRCHGYLLLEMLVFIALMVVILDLAYAAYWRCADNAKRLQQNADDILAAVEAGERWRDDIRLAQNAVTNQDGVKIIQPGDTIEYRFDQQAVWRHSTQTGQKIRLLSKVKTSAMLPEARRQVRAWRWEVELQSRKAPPYLHPLFTFEAVPEK